MSPDIIRFVLPEQPAAEQATDPAAPPTEKLTTKASAHEAFGNALRLIELPPASDQFGSDPTKAFWFDYLSDTGDGQRATYSVAYACSVHLAPGSTRLWAKVTPAKAADSGAESAADRSVLPRGRFLFVGGDTSYTVAEYSTLVERLQSRTS